MSFENKFASARKKAISLDFAHLNEAQREAVLITEGPLLILAGAGSGKTTVLINRIANLLAYGRGSDTGEIPEWATETHLEALEDYIASPTREKRAEVRKLLQVEPVEPWRIIAITFTNKAAGEIKARLEDMLGVSARDVWAMTFHSACARMLRRDIGRIGYDTSFAIYDSSDSLAIIKRIIKEQGINDKDIPPKSVLGTISRAKDAEILPDEFIDEAEKRHDVRKRVIGGIYAEYQKRLKQSNALDFDDLIRLTVLLLNKDTEAREYYQRRFRYVLVDEYQDTNGLQYKFAALLAGGHGNICVVGDDDQSIYKFRGATVENILQFEKNYPGTHIVRLERNYRSTSPILNAANDVISHNKSRHKKKLWTDKDDGALPVVHLADNERGEARFVADTIIENVSKNGSWGGHAVLYRMNAQSNNFEYEFKRNNIPYKVYGGTGFFERAEIKDVMAYMCTVNNPGDEVHMLRIINNPPRGIGQTTIDAVTQIAAGEGQTLYETISGSGRYPRLERAAAKLQKFGEMIEYLRKMSTSLPLDEFYDVLIEVSGMIKALEAKNTDENLTRVENIRELKTNIINFMRENPEGTLADFLGEVALYTDLDSMSENADHVAIMTMHAAKGLEFDAVFIVGAEDGIFPGIRAIGEPEEMEEERRLCYVAMTRAKRQLFFVQARSRMLFGKTTANKVSRFIEEIAPGNIERPAPSDDFWFDSPSGGFARERTFGTPSPYKPQPPRRSEPLRAPTATGPRFTVGDRVSHKAFGAGTVKNVTPTGGDALLEIEFDTQGTKRLMQKHASAYMTKAT